MCLVYITRVTCDHVTCFQVPPARIVISPLTSLLCEVLSLTDPMAVLLKQHGHSFTSPSPVVTSPTSSDLDSSVTSFNESGHNTTFNPEEISLEDSDDEVGDDDEPTKEVDDSTQESNKPPTDNDGGSGGGAQSLSSKLASMQPRNTDSSSIEEADSRKEEEQLETNLSDQHTSDAQQENLNKQTDVADVQKTCGSDDVADVTEVESKLNRKRASAEDTAAVVALTPDAPVTSLAQEAATKPRKLIRRNRNIYEKSSNDDDVTT